MISTTTLRRCVLLTALFLFAAIAAGFPRAGRTAPAECQPNSGATSLCASLLTTPWIYNHNTCGTTRYEPNEAASLGDELQYDFGSACNVSNQRNGWLTTPRFVGFCGGGSTYPLINFGFEVANASNYSFTWESCSPQVVYSGSNDAVIRTRGVVCPEGYELAGGAYCRLSDLDRGKQLGPPCPGCGNPINPALGNKFQQEVDYEGTGAFPLRLVRYYNSMMRIWDTDAGLYGVGNYATQFGNSSVPALARADNEPRYAAIGLDLIGANWRHSYQGSIVLIEGAQITTAYVYRPTGQVLIFNESNGAYVGPADMKERLERLPNGSWKLTTPADEVETYTALGRLASISNRSGLTHTLGYDVCGRLGTVSDDFGHVLTFHYDSSDCTTFGLPHRIASITDPAGGTYQYAYGGTGTLNSVTYPDNTSRQYQYGDGRFTRALTGLVDESGGLFANWAYNAAGKATSSQHAGGAEAVSVSYQSFSGSLITDAAGTWHYYEFTFIQGVNKVTRIEQPAASGSGAANAYYSCDAKGNLTRYRDFRGNLTCRTYDLSRNLETQRVEGLSGFDCPGAAVTGVTRTITTTWHPTLRLPDVVTEAGRTTDYDYDVHGNLIQKVVTDTAVTPTVSRTWSYTYDLYGRVLTEDGPRTDVSDVTTYTYSTCTVGNQCGQLHTVTDALGHVTTFNTYNANGRPLTITGPDSAVTTLTYDLRQRITSQTTAGETTTFQYWPTGLLKKVTRADSSFLLNTYDGAHRLIKIEDGSGNRIEYTLDASGNRTHEKSYDPSNALTRARTQVFNTLSRLWKVVGAADTAAVTTTFSYDDEGNQTGSAAPLGRNSGNQYDALNRLKQATDPGAGVSQFGYDTNDNLTSVTDPRGLVTSYTYNGFGDRVQLVSPDTGTQSSTFDRAGNPITSTDARGVTGTYTYDALSRLTAIAFPDQTVGYTYDSGTNGVGRLTGASDANHSMAWSYDAQGRVVGKTQVVASVSRSVGYGYTNGNLTSIIMPSGQTIAYGYTAGRVSSVAVNGTTVLNNVLYEPFGPVRQWTWGNTTASVQSHDLDGKVSQLDSGGDFYEYAYDDAFRITGVTNTTDASLSWNYGYDSRDRLTGATSTPRNESWLYDANGNRTSESGSTAGVPFANTLAMSGTSNRVASITGSRANTYGYDAAGNISSETNAGRPVGIASTTTVSYLYNALSQRIWKSGPTSATFFVYDEAGHLLGEYGSGGALVQETVWLGDTPVATLRPRSGGGVDLYYVHTDHLGTPRKVSRPSDNVLVWRWDPSPFGNTEPNENPQGAGAFRYNMRYPGQYYDAESGLNYNYFRDYDPYTGRYLESDPVGLAGGINTYAYVGGHPSQAVDPTGLFTLTMPVNVRKVGRVPGSYPWPIGWLLGKIQLGGTAAFEHTRCDCKQSCGQWKLDSCSSRILVDVAIRDDLNDLAEQSASRAEAEHVSDFLIGAADIRVAGTQAESDMKAKPFLSKLDCEMRSLNAVSSAVKAAAAAISADSSNRYDGPGGSHTSGGWPF